VPSPDGKLAVRLAVLAPAVKTDRQYQLCDPRHPAPRGHVALDELEEDSDDAPTSETNSSALDEARATSSHKAGSDALDHTAAGWRAVVIRAPGGPPESSPGASGIGRSRCRRMSPTARAALACRELATRQHNCQEGG